MYVILTKDKNGVAFWPEGTEIEYDKENKLWKDKAGKILSGDTLMLLFAKLLKREDDKNISVAELINRLEASPILIKAETVAHLKEKKDVDS
jgi:hypothetical protein